MNSKVRNSFLAILVVGSVALVGRAALANVIGLPGIAFRPDIGSQTPSFNAANTAAGQNIGVSPVLLTGHVPFHTSSPVFITGVMSVNSRFRAFVTNGVGNFAWLGPLMVGQQDGLAANTLSLGTPPAFVGSALVVKANLEPQGLIGLVWQ